MNILQNCDAAKPNYLQIVAPVSSEALKYINYIIL